MVSQLTTDVEPSDKAAPNVPMTAIHENSEGIEQKEEQTCPAHPPESEFQKALGVFHPDEIEVLKNNLLSRLSELKCSFTSSFNSSSSKKSILAPDDDYTMTGVFLDDETHASRSLNSRTKSTGQSKAKKEDGSSAAIRLICRNRANYNLLVSAVLNMSERTGSTSNLTNADGNEELHVYREREQGIYEEVDEEQDEEQDEESLVSFSVEDQELDDFMASFAESSTSTLTKFTELHVIKSRHQPPKRSKSSEMLKNLVARFSTKKTKSDFEELRRPTPDGLVVDLEYKRSKSSSDDALSKYLASKEFVRHFNSWKNRIEE